uniref:Uncharacterized protein n=1 Tax=Arundo donax TaxID=35708 RepID=A0A0A9F517_ARUDO
MSLAVSNRLRRSQAMGAAVIKLTWCGHLFATRSRVVSS